MQCKSYGEGDTRISDVKMFHFEANGGIFSPNSFNGEGEYVDPESRSRTVANSAQRPKQCEYFYSVRALCHISFPCQNNISCTDILILWARARLVTCYSPNCWMRCTSEALTIRQRVSKKDADGHDQCGPPRAVGMGYTFNSPHPNLSQG